MSLFSKGLKMVSKSPLLKGAMSMIPGGAMVAATMTAYDTFKGITNSIRPPGGGIGGGQRMPALPGRIATGGMMGGGRALVGGVIGGVVRGGRAIWRSAATYCRKHPQWCSTIGGIAAVEAMIGRGELPTIKKSRGRGITARELRSFKKVARFTSKYCAPVKKAMKSPALRRGKCA